MASSKLMLKLEHVNLYYEAVLPRVGRRARETIGVHALKDITFEAHQGDGIGLIGHNGAGKSTLLQVVAGFLPPNEGSVLASSQPRFLERGRALKTKLNGRQNIKLGLLANGLTKQEVDAVADQIAEFSELGEALDRPISGYSSGMRSRLCFAIATAQQPEILLLDESLAVGDRKFKRKALRWMREAIDESGVFILATHTSSEILRTCNRVMWLDQGTIKMDGEPEAVLEAFETYMDADAR